MEVKRERMGRGKRESKEKEGDTEGREERGRERWVG